MSFYFFRCWCLILFLFSVYVLVCECFVLNFLKANVNVFLFLSILLHILFLLLWLLLLSPVLVVNKLHRSPASDFHSVFVLYCFILFFMHSPHTPLHTVRFSIDRLSIRDVFSLFLWFSIHILVWICDVQEIIFFVMFLWARIGKRMKLKDCGKKWFQ